MFERGYATIGVDQNLKAYLDSIKLNMTFSQLLEALMSKKPLGVLEADLEELVQDIMAVAYDIEDTCDKLRNLMGEHFGIPWEQSRANIPIGDESPCREVVEKEHKNKGSSIAVTSEVKDCFDTIKKQKGNLSGTDLIRDLIKEYPHRLDNEDELQKTMGFGGPLSVLEDSASELGYNMDRLINHVAENQPRELEESKKKPPD
ncbi:MAG: hypothetical protein GY845_37630 [Planctomycetes bacterium]|nr:hypothetical protein [Planctomycetota bacterium]